MTHTRKNAFQAFLGTGRVIFLSGVFLLSLSHSLLQTLSRGLIPRNGIVIHLWPAQERPHMTCIYGNKNPLQVYLAAENPYYFPESPNFSFTKYAHGHTSSMLMSFLKRRDLLIVPINV